MSEADGAPAAVGSEVVRPQVNWAAPPPSDPTALTTALVDRAVTSFREVMETRLSGMDRATDLVAQELKAFRAEVDVSKQRQREAMVARVDALGDLIDSRISAMDKATELLAATVGRVPSETDKAIDALRQLLGARIDGMDTATKLLADSMSKFPSDVDRAVTSLKALLLAELQRVGDVTQEKFTAIDGTFSSNALALTAALAAQKEAAAEQNKSNTLAITKSESSTKETIGANAAQAQTANASLAAQVTDIKERVVRIESSGAGVQSVTGSPYESALLRQAQEQARQAQDQADRTARQAEDAAQAARLVATGAQQRAVMALIISAVLLIVTFASVIFAITKK